MTLTGEVSTADPAIAATTTSRAVGWRAGAVFGVLLVVFGAVVVIGIAVGSVRLPIPSVVAALAGGDVDQGTAVIVHQVRIPRTVTASLCGAALGLAGLQMQTLFRNPLADPFVLGVSSGASLAVAAVTLATGSGVATLIATRLGLSGRLAVVAVAVCGSMVTMGLVLVAGRFVKSSTTLLLLGVMISYLAGALQTVLVSAAAPQELARFVQWGFGSYRGVTWADIQVMAPVLLLGIAAVFLTTKPLNALLLGERYAASLGVELRRTRVAIIAASSILAGTVTAFAGPIQFIGIVIPHLARGVFRTSDHRVLIPGCVLIGASMATLADVVSQLPVAPLPLNAVNALFGAPLVLAVLLRRGRDGAGGA